MKLAITIVFAVASASSVFADNDFRLAVHSDDIETATPAGQDDRLFDFPISRALGIDPKEMLKSTPSVFDLAALTGLN